MAAYRFESSPSSRAQCSNAECKHDKVKIQKHELRVGTWIDTERFQSWSWRHWGCTTPKIIENISNAWKELQGDSQEKDYSLLDGYPELGEEYQAKVRKALDQGHIDDEDWNGDVEVNRPGKVGFRVRGGKKAAAKESNGDEGDASPKGKPSAAKKAVDGNEGAATEEDPKTDSKAVTKEIAADKKVGSTAQKKEPKATATGDNNAATQEEAGEEAPQKRRRGRPRKEATSKQALASTLTLKKGNNNQEEDTEGTPEIAGRRTAAATTEKTPIETAKNDTEPKIKDDSQEETAEEKPKKRRAGRPRKDSIIKPAPTEIAKKGANDQEAAEETPKARGRLTRSATKKATSPEAAKAGTKRKAQPDDEKSAPPKASRGRRKSEKIQVKEAEAGPSETPKSGRKPAEKK